MTEELPRKVPARAGLDWVIRAFKLFAKSPLILAAAAGVSIGALLILQFIPYAGAGLAEILSPFIAAGFMRAYRAIDEDAEPELPQFLTGFRSHAVPLAAVGAIYLAALSAVLMLMKGLGVDYTALHQVMQEGAGPEQLAAALEGKGGLLLLGMALLLPAVAASWYAPALVVFGNAAPLQAMGLSLKACLRNWPALLVNGLVMLPVLFLALVPLFGLMILLPVMLGGAYLGYQAMFASQQAQPSGGA